MGATKDVTDVFSRSLLPFVVEHLLGGPILRHKPHGQIALRFPGDFCQPPGSFNAPYLAQHLTHWHIDGCATDHAPDQQHYGTIKNFSVLVGVLLSDVAAPVSGELVAFPGSHDALARHLAQPGELQRVRDQGARALPTGPERTAALFQRPPHHCVGRKGDAFLLNYMTAHTIAPNCSADVRYALYFRIHSAQFGPQAWQTHRPEPMLSPWCDWAFVRRRRQHSSGGGGGVGGALDAAATPAPPQPLPATSQWFGGSRGTGATPTPPAPLPVAVAVAVAGGIANANANANDAGELDEDVQLALALEDSQRLASPHASEVDAAMAATNYDATVPDYDTQLQLALELSKHER